MLTITDWRTALLNIVGGVLVMYSLLWSFNLASFVVQAFWMLFTVIGMVKAGGCGRGRRADDLLRRARK